MTLKTHTHLLSYALIFSLFSALMACGGDNDVDPDTDDDGIDIPTDDGPVAPVDFSCADCDLVITADQQLIDGETLAITEGTIVCFQTGVEYANITFENINGTPADPVVIRNCDGVAVVNSTGAFGVKFKHSKDFKFLGDGSADDKYGIKITTTGGFYLTMELFTTDFEIAYVEIAGKNPNGLGDDSGFAGIGIKTSPYQDCDVFADPSRTAWIMEDIEVHDNYIHDTGGEGMYIGHGFYNGRTESSCSQETWSHSIHNVRIYDNRIEDTGYDGIQIKNCDLNVEVYNNTVTNYGTHNEGAHNEGLFIGEGTTGKFYNNIVVNGTGHGIQMQGMGNLDIYNNVIVNPGGNGFYGASGNHAFRIEDGYFNIINNTFVNSGENGFVFFNNDGGVKRLINNIFAVSGDENFRKGAAMDTSNNIFTQDLPFLQFTNSASDFTLTGGSPAIDAGVDVSEYGITEDILGNPRPSGSGYDLGAHERQ